MEHLTSNQYLHKICDRSQHIRQIPALQSIQKENNDQFAENQSTLVLSLKEIIAESIKYIKTLDNSECSYISAELKKFHVWLKILYFMLSNNGFLNIDI